jgi:hypothetical protein
VLQLWAILQQLAVSWVMPLILLLRLLLLLLWWASNEEARKHVVSLPAHGLLVLPRAHRSAWAAGMMPALQLQPPHLLLHPQQQR